MSILVKTKKNHTQNLYFDSQARLNSIQELNIERAPTITHDLDIDHHIQSDLSQTEQILYKGQKDLREHSENDEIQNSPMSKNKLKKQFSIIQEEGLKLSQSIENTNNQNSPLNNSAHNNSHYNTNNKVIVTNNNTLNANNSNSKHPAETPIQTKENSSNIEFNSHTDTLEEFRKEMDNNDREHYKYKDSDFNDGSSNFNVHRESEEASSKPKADKLESTYKAEQNDKHILNDINLQAKETKLESKKCGFGDTKYKDSYAVSNAKTNDLYNHNSNMVLRKSSAKKVSLKSKYTTSRNFLSKSNMGNVQMINAVKSTSMLYRNILNKYRQETSHIIRKEKKEKDNSNSNNSNSLSAGGDFKPSSKKKSTDTLYCKKSTKNKIQSENLSLGNINDKEKREKSGNWGNALNNIQSINEDDKWDDISQEKIKEAHQEAYSRSNSKEQNHLKGISYPFNLMSNEEIAEKNSFDDSNEEEEDEYDEENSMSNSVLNLLNNYNADLQNFKTKKQEDEISLTDETSLAYSKSYSSLPGIANFKSTVFKGTFKFRNFELYFGTQLNGSKIKQNKNMDFLNHQKLNKTRCISKEEIIENDKEVKEQMVKFEDDLMVEDSILSNFPNGYNSV